LRSSFARVAARLVNCLAPQGKPRSLPLAEVSALRLAAALISLTVGLRATEASAQDANADANTSVTSNESRDAVATTPEAALHKGEAPARFWWIGWTTAYGVLAASQGVFALATKDTGLRADAAVGAAKSALGFVATLVAPHAATWAVAEIAQMDTSTPEARACRDRAAHHLLERSAADEQFWRSWLSHLGAGLINLAGGFVLWLGYDRFVPGLLSFASGMAVAEVQIFTHPMTATRALSDSTRSAPASRAAALAGWSVGVMPGGLTLSSSF
jgi:hypothetical protein